MLSNWPPFWHSEQVSRRLRLEPLGVGSGERKAEGRCHASGNTGVAFRGSPALGRRCSEGTDAATPLLLWL